MTIAKPTFDSLSLPGFCYEAWGIVVGRYTPQSEDCCNGILVMPDGIEFAARIKGGVSGKLKRAIEHSYGQFNREQALIEPSYWLVFPKHDETGQLLLTLARFFKYAPPKPKQIFLAIGLLEHQHDGTIALSVSRNRPNPNRPDEPPRSIIVHFQGFAPNLESGQPVQIIGHREGEKLVADDVQLVTPELIAQKQQQQEVTRQRAQLHRQAKNAAPKNCVLGDELFQAIACIEGQFIAQADDSNRGTIRTPDGIEFPAHLARIHLKKLLTTQYGAIEPEQPFPAHPLNWAAYPSLSEDKLTLTLVGMRTEKSFLEPEQMKVQGVLIRQEADRFFLRVYRNITRWGAQQLTDFSDLMFLGTVPENAQLGDSYRVLAHRAGEEFVATEVEAIAIGYGIQVKEAIDQLLHPSPPAPRPVKAKQPDQTAAETTVEADVATAAVLEMESETIALPDSTTASTIAQSLLPIAEKVELDLSAPRLIVGGTIANGKSIPIESSTPPDIAATVQSNQKAKKQKQTATPAQIATPTKPTEKSQKVKHKTATSPTSVAPDSEQKQPAATPLQPNFVVQVDRRKFSGTASVDLRTGMLFIDGKQVAQTKLAIVVGKPQHISADGKVQPSGDRTILTSR